jgi:high-affinity iron transporter
MGLAFLRLPHARMKWRLKLLQAVEGAAGVDQKSASSTRRRQRKMGARAARGWILFGLPFITVLREGLEGVVFLGGIGLTGSPLSIFTGALAGFLIGGVLAVTLFTRSEAMTLQRFTTFSTVILFLMGAGLASRSAYSLERQYFINAVGSDAAEAGDGPGSFRVAHNIWKLWGANPEPGHYGYSGFWQLAQSLVGWNNIGTYWTV